MSHSYKANKTLAMMGTVGTDWKQADIRWVYEMRTALRPITCPTCLGYRFVYSKADKYEPVSIPESVKTFYERQDWLAKAIKEQNLVKKNCKTCETYKRPGKWSNGGFISTGSVMKPTKVKILVGYPVWPEGVRFDSRFKSSMDRYCCELCSKSLSSYQVPVVGKGSDGVVHGMWVGTDCAKKFLEGIQIMPPSEKKEEFVMDEERKS